MKEIYIVKYGDGIHYVTDKVFSSQELAEKYVASFKKSIFEGFIIIPLILNQYEAQLALGFKPFVVRIYKDGKLLDVVRADDPHNFEGGIGVYFVQFPRDKSAIMVHIFAESKKDAVEKTQKIREAILEAGTWMQK